MKNTTFFVAAGLALALFSCGGANQESTEKTTFNLDTEASTLSWKGSKSATYAHTGTVSLKEGSIEMEGDKLVGGTFVIDMNNITVSDKDLPADKKEMLAGHLKDTSFFFTAKHPNITVKVNGYENGKLDAVVNILGQDMKQSLPVTMKVTEKDVQISGKFTMDVATLKLAGMEPDPKSGEKIQSTIEFELDLKLKK
jgi:polyisoprenoid-binding protein YceI